MDDKFKLEEKLFRAALPASLVWDEEECRFSTALFKDSNGASVDRDDNRTDGNIVKTMIDKLTTDKVKAIVYVHVDNCNKLPSHLKYNPLDDNIYHSEIHDSEEKKVLAKGKLRQLVKDCILVYSEMDIKK
jgi:hypothetical protein